MGRIERFVTRIIGREKTETSENIELLLSLGNIEKLVGEGRTPLNIGMIGSVNEEPKQYYQVPPIGFDPVEIKLVCRSVCGAFLFIGKDGTRKIGSTYTLTSEQARQVEKRILQAN